MTEHIHPVPASGAAQDANQNLKQPLSFKPTDDTDLRLITKDGELKLAPASCKSKTLARSLRISKAPKDEIHEVYFEDTFFEVLLNDLEWATGIIIIHCPFLKDYRLGLLLEVLARCVKRGVRVCVFIRQPHEKYDSAEEIKLRMDLAKKLLEINVHVTIRPNIHEKLIIIDELIFWEGSCPEPSWFV